MTERIVFDFKERWRGSLQKLEDIICYASWGNRGLNVLDQRVIFLTELLHIGAIVINEERCQDIKAHSPEMRHRAEMLGAVMRKRKVSYALLNLAGTFSSQEYEPNKTMNFAPYFPELRAYVRCDGLEPRDLLEFLECDHCERVIVFPNYPLENGWFAYYTFESAVPRVELIKALARFREQQFEVMSAAILKAEEQFNVFPELPGIEDSIE